MTRKVQNIRKNKSVKCIPFKHHFNIVVLLGFTGVYLFFLFPDLCLLVPFSRKGSFIVGEINIYIILYIYIWRLKECKMNFYRMFSKVSARFQDKAEALRMDVFKIVKYDKEGGKHQEKQVREMYTF